MIRIEYYLKSVVLTAFLLIVVFSRLLAQENGRLKYVNPFIGTTKSGVLTKWGGSGGTYPGAVAPAGSIQVSPETRVSGAKGYDYTDGEIFFFSCIKHYSGFPEGSSGRLFIMPVRDANTFEPRVTKRSFSHKNEHAIPGYYRVTFSDDHTKVEAAAALRSSIIRLTFPASVKPQVFIGDAGQIGVISLKVLHGSLANTVINFSDNVLEQVKVKDGYVMKFKPNPKGEKIIILKVSTSTVNHSGAQQNIEKELGTLTLEKVSERTQAEWRRQLATVDVSDSDEEKKTIFYTALYHSLLIPWVISDVNGTYKGPDGKVHQTVGNHQYGGFSPWDTFRTLHPLLTLLYPQKQQDVVLSMLDYYRQAGHLPTESMTGNHAVPIIVDSYFKGIQGFDTALAYRAMKKSIMDPPFVQKDLEIYHKTGYVPFSNAESVTRTVEYAYNDWALSRYADLVMHNDKDYKLLEKRGLNYRNLFFPDGLFMLPRKDSVFKVEPGMTGYKEGDKWVYSYFVPHNGKDLVNLMGGDIEFAQRLDSVLRHNVILYDNETVLHLPYLFNAAGHPGLTQKWIREIMLNRFSANPAGLPGNDDLGSMSSAYIFNALGFFPMSPGLPLYSLGAPLFQSVTLNLPNKKTFVIKAEGQSNDNKFVKTLMLNQQPHEELIMSHDAIAQGGTLEFKMSNIPSSTWPADKDPIALSKTKAASAIALLDYRLISPTRTVTTSLSTVAPNEQFWVRFRLQNKGSLGTKKVTLYINQKVHAIKHCLVPEGETVIDSISCRLYQPGKVDVLLSTTEEVGLDRGRQNYFSVIVKESSRSVAHPLKLSALTIKPVIGLGERQEFSYTLQNLTGRRRTFSIPVFSGDQLLYTDVVKLEPGEKQVLEHSFVPKAAGLYTLKVETEQSRFKVYNDHLSSLLLDISLMRNNDTTTIEDRSGFGNRIHVKSGVYPAGGKLLPLGPGTFVDVEPSENLDQMEESLTMMAWVFPKGGEPGLVDLLTKGDHHVLQTNDNKTLTFFAGGWGRGDCTVDLPENWKDEWHHIAGVCKADMLWLYIDGALAGSAKVDGTVNLSVNSRWEVGRNEEFPSERVFHGFMDRIKVFAQPLGSVEIAKIVNAEKELLNSGVILDN